MFIPPPIDKSAADNTERQIDADVREAETAVPSTPTAGPWYLGTRMAMPFRYGKKLEFYIDSAKGDVAVIPYAAWVARPIEEAKANALLMAAAPSLRKASQSLYNAINAYLMDVEDVPAELEAAMDELEAAWHQADGTQPEVE